MSDQRPDRGSNNTSGSRTGHASDSYERLVCWQFIEEYAQSFARHFDRSFREAVGDSPETAPPVSGAELYFSLFTEDTLQDSEPEINNLLVKLVQHTFEADTILTRTFLHMIKDVADCLIHRSGMLHELDMIMGRIHDVSGLVFEAYYQVSRPVVISIPDIDRYTYEYQKMLTNFNKYREREEDHNSDVELKIHTFYHSIPIDLNATVKAVGTDSVTFNIHPYEAVALSHLGIAIIKSSLHNAVFRAYTSHVDIQKQTATFSHLIIDEQPSLERSYVRVEPVQPVITRIIGESVETQGIIYDISEVAATVYIRTTDISQYPLGSTIRFSASLPDPSGDGIIAIETLCSIIVIYNEEKGDPLAYRLVLQYENDQSLRSKLSMYVSRRQVEIIRELKELSHITE